jgi:hypothetical protein
METMIARGASTICHRRAESVIGIVRHESRGADGFAVPRIAPVRTTCGRDLEYNSVR